MGGKRWHRVAALLLLAVLLLAGLSLLGVDPALADHRRVLGVIRDETTGSLLSLVNVTLHDAHGQKDPRSFITGGDGTYSFGPPLDTGFYFITVRRDNYFDNETAVLRFDDTVSVRKDIRMARMPSPTLTLTVQVNDTMTPPNPIPNATVEVFNTSREQVVRTGLTDPDGEAVFDLWSGEFELRMAKAGFEKNVTDPFTLDTDTFKEVHLNSSVEVTGIATNADGTQFLSEGLTASLFNVDTETPDAKRLLLASVDGSSFSFDAYPGTFILVVDADGHTAHVVDLIVGTDGVFDIEAPLDISDDEEVKTALLHPGGDWNNLTLWRNLTLNPDSSVAGLPFAEVRHLRLQIDLALGNGDGILEAAEKDLFLQWLHDAGPKHVDTNGFFTVNSRYYRSDVDDVSGETDYAVSFESFPETGPVTIVSIANYSVPQELDPIPDRDETYFVNVTTSHDTDNAVRVNATYTLHTVAGYERARTTTEGEVAVQNYSPSVLIDPQVAPGSFRVEVEVEVSEPGVARVAVVAPPNRFTELNTSQENYTVILPTNVSMTFSAEESTDPNGPGTINPDSNFTWDFDNASASVTVYGIRPDATFDVLGRYDGNLTIKDVGGLIIYRDLTILVDGILPVAKLENNVTGLGEDAHNTTIEVDEGQSVRFFAGNSTDEVFPGREGVVRAWRWDFDGDGTTDATGRSVTWTFDEPGSFDANLTVVDQAGHESPNATLRVVVADTTPPEAAFRILSEDFVEVTRLTEKVAYTFDATATEDNFDAQANLTFTWDFGNGDTAQDTNVTYTYPRYGTYALVLNVTDRAGNTGNATENLDVAVDPSMRPDLEVELNSLVIEPRSPEESTFFGSVVVTVRLNVTNREGRATAQGINVNFFAFRFGEAPDLPVGIQPTFTYIANGTSPLSASEVVLPPGEKLAISFTWTTGPLGNYTLRVNVTAPEEPDLFIGPRNTAETQVDVREAAWKRPLLIGSIVAVIVGIPVAIYFRRRIAGRVRERITKR